MRHPSAPIRHEEHHELLPRGWPGGAVATSIHTPSWCDNPNFTHYPPSHNPSGNGGPAVPKLCVDPCPPSGANLTGIN